SPPLHEAQHGDCASEVGSRSVDHQPLSGSCQPDHNESIRESGPGDEAQGDCASQTGCTPVAHTVEQKPHYPRLAGVSLSTSQNVELEPGKPRITGLWRGNSTLVTTAHVIWNVAHNIQADSAVGQCVDRYHRTNRTGDH